MFSQSADLYDAIYSFKDYAAESERLRDLIRLQGGPVSGRLLDVGCGTGAHLQHLRGHYEVEGLDLDADLLKVASFVWMAAVSITTRTRSILGEVGPRVGPAAESRRPRFSLR